MKLLFGLLMLMGVLFTNDSFAERRGRCYGGGWSEPVFSGSCGAGYFDSGWVECGSPVVYSSPVYYSPSCSSSSVVYRSASPRRVVINGEVWTVVEDGYAPYEEVQPRYATPSQQKVASPQRQVQQHQYEEQPITPAQPQRQKPQRDLLTNPSRNETPSSRYNDVEFFKAPKR